jgi:hypothetical protein
MTWKGRARRATVACVLRGRPRKLPALPGMPVPGGVEHRKAPERLPDAVETPWELLISRRSAGFRAGQTPCGAGPKRHGSPRRGGLKRVRGRAGAKALVTARGSWAPKGACGLWNHGRGTRADGLKCLRVRRAFDLVFLRVRGCRALWTEGCKRRGNATSGPMPERASRARTP